MTLASIAGFKRIPSPVSGVYFPFQAATSSRRRRIYSTRRHFFPVSWKRCLAETSVLSSKYNDRGYPEYFTRPSSIDRGLEFVSSPRASRIEYVHHYRGVRSILSLPLTVKTRELSAAIFTIKLVGLYEIERGRFYGEITAGIERQVLNGTRPAWSG